MPDERIETLNPPSDSSSDGALSNEGNSPKPETQNDDGASSTPVMDGDDLVSTVDFQVVEPKAKPEEKPTGEGENPEKESPKEHDPVPYSRFQEKAHEAKELRDKIIELEKKAAVAEKAADIFESQQKGGPKKDTEGASSKRLEYQNIVEKSDDDISDWIDRNPKDFLINFGKQVIQETRDFVARDVIPLIEQHLDQSFAEKDLKTKFQTKLDEFGQQNDGFKQMYESGELEKFVKENPGFDVFSAYREKKGAGKVVSDADIQARIDAAVKEATEKVKQEYTKNIKAKRDLRPIDAGPSSHNGTDKELEDTNSSGGLVASIAGRLSRSRRQA